MKKKLFFLLIAFVLVLGLIPAIGAAAATLYETNSSSVVPIWSSPSSSSDLVTEVPAKGYILRIRDSVTNSSGNLWYEIDSGSYGGKSIAGKWVYSGNVKTHSHDYTGGICDKCGYEYKLSITSISGSFQVTNADGATIWSRPYSNNSKQIKVASKGTVLSVNGKATNQAGNLWYRLTDGNWVYSGNVKQRYTITYNGNGGSPVPGNQYKLNGSSITLSTVKPGKVGYNFQCWNTKSDGSGTSFSSGSTYSANSNLTLYAKYTACSHDYEGGICIKCGYEYKLSITSISGTFVVTNADGATIWNRPYSYNSTQVRVASKGSALSVNGKATNAADNLWYRLTDGNWVYSGNVKQRYTITYNANGGTCSLVSQTKLHGSSITLSSTKPTRVGYNFKCWNTKSDGSGTSYNPGATYSANANATLYAIWTACTHDYEGGICIKCKYEYPLTITSFSAYFKVTNADGATIWKRPYSYNSTEVRVAAKGSVLSINAKTTNAAGNLWYRLTDGNWVYSGNLTRCYKVSYVLNSGKNNSSNPTYYMASEEITLKSATRTGYTFAGWYKESVFTNKITKISKGSTGNVTLYAKWTANTYKIAFNGNGSTSGSMATKSVTYGKSFTLPSNAFARTGYTFNGWNTKKDGSGTNYANGASVSNLTATNGATVTLYAKWKAIPKPTITTQPTSVSVAYGKTATFKVVASGTGLSYQWQYSSNGGSTWNTPSFTSNTATLSMDAIPARDGLLFRCIVKNVSGSVTSNSVKLTVTGYKPAITTQPKAVTVALNGTAKFSVAASGISLKYQWYYSADGGKTWKVPSFTSNTSSISLTANSARNGPLFRCTVKTSYGTATSNAVKLTAMAKPAIKTQPVSVKTANGNTATFKITATGSSLTYQWQYSADNGNTWKNTSFASNSATVSMKAISARNGLLFHCVVKNAVGTAVSNAVRLTVTGVKPAIVSQPTSVTAANGSTVTMKIVAIGSGMSYQWQYSADGGKTWKNTSFSSNSATIYLDAIPARNGLLFHCVVKNSYGTTTSAVAKLIVK